MTLKLRATHLAPPVGPKSSLYAVIGFSPKADHFSFGGSFTEKP
jgi:hypothetical protein